MVREYFSKVGLEVGVFEGVWVEVLLRFLKGRRGFDFS